MKKELFARKVWNFTMDCAEGIGEVKIVEDSDCDVVEFEKDDINFRIKKWNKENQYLVVMFDTEAEENIDSVVIEIDNLYDDTNWIMI